MKIIKRQDGGNLLNFINNYNGDLYGLQRTLIHSYGVSNINDILRTIQESNNEKLKKDVETIYLSNNQIKSITDKKPSIENQVLYDDNDKSLLYDKELLSQGQSIIDQILFNLNTPSKLMSTYTPALRLDKPLAPITWQEPGEKAIYAENSNKIPIENVQPTKKPNQVNDVVNTATDVLGMLGPYGAIASTVLSSATNFLAGTGLATSKYTQNPDSMSSGYSGVTASDISNFDYIFGNGKSDLEKQKTRDDRIAEILLRNKDRKHSAAMQQQKNTSILNGGVNTVAVGKTGMKLPITIEVYDEKWFVNDISSLKDGGNIIPVGALHARLNNMDSSLDVTKKGIPVVDNNGIQHAEIEKEEWTINKKFTDKLETANKSAKTLKGIELDNLYIEIGKLVVNELLTNTKDTSKLIKNTKV